MIDFRYHLISIVAVFLALGIGILMGSLVLGEGLVKQLKRELEGIEDRNNEMQATITDLNQRVELNDEYARLSRRHLIAGELEGEEVMLFTYEGLDGGLLDQVRTTVEEAGGGVVATIEATDKLALDTQAERDQLALILSSADDTSAGLNADLGAEVGAAIAEAAAEPPPPPDPDSEPANNPGPAELEELMADLVEGGFLAVEGSPEEEQLVTQGASFVLVGGSDGDPPFRIAEYSVGLANGLASNGAPVVAVESSGSTWGLVTTLRVDDDAQRVVNTIDQAETISGSVAMVLTLEQAEQGIVGRHYGVESGAQLLIPEPAPTP